VLALEVKAEEWEEEEELLPLPPPPPPREDWHTTHFEEDAKFSLYPQLSQCQEFKVSVVVVRRDAGDDGVRLEKSLG